MQKSPTTSCLVACAIAVGCSAREPISAKKSGKKQAPPNAGGDASLATASPKPVGESWAAVARMWDAIREDPARRKLFFSSRYYTEDFSSGTAPLPYRAFHRERVVTGTSGIVVNRQTFLPYQREEGSPLLCDYHGAEIEEAELVFDHEWRFLAERTWVWGTPCARSSEEGPADRLVFGGRRASGYRNIRRNENKIISRSWAQNNTRTYAYDETVPPTEAVLLLLGFGADHIKGRSISSKALQAAVPSFFRVLAEPRAVNDGSGEYVASIEVATEEGQEARPTATLYYRPQADSYSMGGNQCVQRFRPTTKEVYKKELREFLVCFNVKELLDNNGKAVSLPLGVGMREGRRQ